MLAVESDVPGLQGIQIARQAFSRCTPQNWLKKGASNAGTMACWLHAKSGKIPVRFPHLAFMNCTEANPHRLIREKASRPKIAGSSLNPNSWACSGVIPMVPRRHP
jgi:hypothetical protein